MPPASATVRPPRILPVIIVSQFAGTSLWFASNAVLPDLQREWGLGPDVLGITTSAVQLGFILGTLAFAFFTIADRFSPRKIFFLASLCGAASNLLLLSGGGSLTALLVLRFCTGICLGGIYPIGMKIASGWYREGLGHALGFLVGALVVGTAFPHLLRALDARLAWQWVIVSISVLSLTGGLLMYALVPDGPHLASGTRFSPRALPLIFGARELRAAALGYFGHMWELYTFYAFLPLMLQAFTRGADANIPLWTFWIIAAGGVGCAAGGLLSDRLGSARIAWGQLLISGMFCLCSPLLFLAPPAVFLGLFIVWGAAVVGDSPQFSTLIARNAPRELVGSALTIGNSIGFAITILSIETISYAARAVPPEYLFLLLTPGPLIGLFASAPLLASRRSVS
jgi:predicted MFS family arabinose efflux permease